MGAQGSIEIKQSISEGKKLLPYDGQAILFSAYAPNASYNQLLSDINWQEEAIRMFGKVHAVPRLIAYYGDVPYRYAAIDHPAKPLPDLLKMLKQGVEAISGFPFNAALCNYYRHGQDSMGYHRDNEPGIDTRCIASLSFGATRRFKMRHRTTKETITIDLTGGSLLLMLDCQDQWEHMIPKTKKPVEGRINLTFRLMRGCVGKREKD